MMIVVGGYNGQYLDSVEILNVNGIPYECDVPEPYPIKVYGVAGGIIEDRLVLCGGYPVTNSCFSLDPDNGSWTSFPNMLKERYYPAYVETPHGKQ